MEYKKITENVAINSSPIQVNEEEQQQEQSRMRQVSGDRRQAVARQDASLNGIERAHEENRAANEQLVMDQMSAMKLSTDEGNGIYRELLGSYKLGGDSDVMARLKEVVGKTLQIRDEVQVLRTPVEAQGVIEMLTKHYQTMIHLGERYLRERSGKRTWWFGNKRKTLVEKVYVHAKKELAALTALQPAYYLAHKDVPVGQLITANRLRANFSSNKGMQDTSFSDMDEAAKQVAIQKTMAGEFASLVGLDGAYGNAVLCENSEGVRILREKTRSGYLSSDEWKELVERAKQTDEVTDDPIGLITPAEIQRKLYMIEIVDQVLGVEHRKRESIRIHGKRVFDPEKQRYYAVADDIQVDYDANLFSTNEDISLTRLSYFSSKVLDSDLRRTIHQLSPEMIQFMFGNILSGEQIAALNARLEKMDTFLNKQLNKGNVMLGNETSVKQYYRTHQAKHLQPTNERLLTDYDYTLRQFAHLTLKEKNRFDVNQNVVNYRRRNEPLAPGEEKGLLDKKLFVLGKQNCFSYRRMDKDFLAETQKDVREKRDRRAGHTIALKDNKDVPLFTHKPCAADVRQGGLGDCYMLATIARIAEQNPDFILKMMREDNKGNVVVRFYDGDAKPFYVEVSKSTLVVKSREGDQETPFAARDELWVQILEKAFAISGARYVCASSYTRLSREAHSLLSIAGGDRQEALFMITGKLFQIRAFQMDEADALDSVMGGLSSFCQANKIEKFTEPEGVKLNKNYKAFEKSIQTILETNTKDAVDLFFGKDRASTSIEALLQQSESLLRSGGCAAFDEALTELRMQEGEKYDKKKANNIIHQAIERYTRYLNEDAMQFTFYHEVTADNPTYTNYALQRYDELERRLAKKELLIVGTRHALEKSNTKGLNGEEIIDGFALGHAYTLMGVHKEGNRYLVDLRNPWGKGIPQFCRVDGAQQVEALSEMDRESETDGVFSVDLNVFLSVADNMTAEREQGQNAG